nr:transposase, MuDR, MULE transposase domain protein [Tanacetum cinerariifolium]
MTSEITESTTYSDLVFQEFVNSYSCDELVFDVFYNVYFLYYPIKYVKHDVWHWFYCKPDCILEEGLTNVENDKDVKKMYEMANLHDLLEVYIAYIPQVPLIDFYLNNLCVDESDKEVTSKLRTHKKKKKDFDSMSLEEMISWQQEEAQSPCYLRSPHLKPKSSVTKFKGKALLDNFEAVKGEGLGSSSSNFL